ncbi:MAG: 3-deoxy-manno-octulosonate cytidylyltransferase [Deltaproteobacteria bacterium]|nr:MAG: 3-deoxy-manno-octulosonate cytidylyltransferase [Deltaproteobacteria bacterium]
MTPIAENLLTRARRVKLVVLDVDGVLTDGRLVYTEEGEAAKRFHAHDGLGIRLLHESGIEVAIATARGSKPLERRVAELKIRHFRTDARDKLAAVQLLALELGLELDQICFAGDDVLDLPALRAVGLAASVADAHPAARDAAHWVSERKGGCGAVRQLADLIVEAQEGLEGAYARMLSSEQEQQQERALEQLRFGVIIPARYGSSRLPGKPLVDLAGKPMIVHVLENARQSGAAFVVVATDDERVARTVEAAGGEAVMTSANHASGTDRLAEVVERMGLSGDTIVVNVQGDEPLLRPALVSKVARALVRQPMAGIATLATPIHEVDEVFDPAVVKVIVNHAGLAVTFSRAPIPWVREVFQTPEMPTTLPEWPTFLRHVGLYAYRVSTLRRITAQAPVPLEEAESLEQLRALWLGIPIQVTVVDEAPARGVDTEADVKVTESMLPPPPALPTMESKAATTTGA